MGKAPPAFQFYPNDFVSGTRQMTTVEVGGYILLLCAQWDDGSVPGDDRSRLAILMRCSKSAAATLWATVGNKFERDGDGHWRNSRLERVRDGQRKFHAKQAANGANGGRPLKPTTEPKAKPSQNPNYKPRKSSSISILQSPDDQNKERSDRVQTCATDFDAFWACYPKRKAKADALKAWTALAPDAALMAAIIDAVNEQRVSVDWLKDQGQFIPYPASWLRARRWEDEAVQVPQVSEKNARSLGAIYGDD